MANEEGITVDIPEGGLAPDRPLAPWEERVADAVGNVIEFWGFKRNQGRVWAVLYVRDAALSASEIQSVMGLSKGAVSMIMRELDQWGVVRRVRRSGGSSWRYAANTELLEMVNRVLATREVTFLSRVRADLKAAEAAAKLDPDVGEDVVGRVTQMRRLADLVERSVRAFLSTARLDISGLVGVLHDKVRRGVSRANQGAS